MQFFEKVILINFTNMRKILWMVGLFLNSFAFAQLGEDFSDGEIAHQPTWMGDTGRVKVNSNLQLQTKPFNRGDTLHLVTMNSYRLNTEWIFYLQLNFDPSTGNLFRYYLFSDVANLQGSLKGYYIQVGESGNADSYDLFRQTNTSSSKIIDGPPKPRALTDTIKSFVKVTYDKNGNWYLYTRDPDSVNWNLEGYTFDISHSIANYTGLYIRHTSTRSDKFVFDDLSIQQFELDVLAPVRIDQQLNNDSILRVEFNEVIDTQSILSISNFKIGLNKYPKEIYYNSSEPNVLEINLGDQLASGLYSIKLPLIKDLYGNQQSEIDSFEFNYTAPVSIEPGAILITELMVDPSPSVSLPSVEYIELYNSSNDEIELRNWTISDGTTTSTINVLLPSNSFLILCKVSDSSLFKNYGRTLGLTTWPSLNNTGDHIQLRNHKNQIIDEVQYDISWYKNTSKKDGGYSLERIDFRNICTAFYNWEASSSVNGGTPGTINEIWRTVNNYEIFRITNIELFNDSTINIQFNKVPDTSKVFNINNYRINGINTNASKIVLVDGEYLKYKLIFPFKFLNNRDYKVNVNNISTCDGNYLEQMFFILRYKELDDTSKLIISEIHFDPYPEVNLPNKEFIELYNPNPYDLWIQNWKLGYNNFEYYLPSKLIKAHEYYIICHPKDSAIFSEYGLVIPVSNFPVLSNTSARIYLKNHISTIMSEVYYHYKWHDNQNKIAGGWSLEQIDPYSICNNAINWRSSKDVHGGSPGYQNSIANFYSDKNDLKILNFRNKNQKVFEIKFSKSLNGTQFNPFQFYLVGPKMQLFFPDSIRIDSPRYENLNVYFSQFMPSGKYEFVFHSLPICGRNDTTLQYKFLINEVADDDDIIISELMVDPSPAINLPESEYIEIQNLASEKYYTKIKLKKGKYSTEFEIDTLFKNTSIVLVDVKHKDLWKEYQHVYFVNNLISLSNSKDSIYLYLNGKICDSVFYDYKDWDTDKRYGGYALELDIEAKDCAAKKSWGNSRISQGSPGTLNSYKLSEHDKNILIECSSDESELAIHINQKFELINTSELDRYEYQIIANKLVFKNLDLIDEDLITIPIHIKSCSNKIFDTTIYFQNNNDKEYQSIVINEVLFNSYPNSSDFIEFYNKGNKAINLRELSLLNYSEFLVLKDSAGIVNYDYFVLPNSYIVITEDKQSVIDNYRYADKDLILEINDLVEMNDKEGRIYLMDQTGMILDYVEYHEDMHLTWLKDIDGRSLERRNIFEEGKNRHNWISASDAIGKASPAIVNSQAIIPGNKEDKLFYLRNKIITPNADGHSDLLELNYDLKNEIMVISADVYDQRGRFISTIFKTYTLSNNGTLIWDITQSNRKIDNGLYLIYIEAFSESGSYNKYKLPFIVDDN